MKIKILSAIVIVALLTGTIAFASSTTVNGTTSGGVDCVGVLYYYNLSTPGEDYARAETTADIAGSLYTYVKIYYQYSDGSYSSSSTSRSRFSTECPTGSVNADTDSQASLAYGKFQYSSNDYGGWVKTKTASY